MQAVIVKRDQQHLLFSKLETPENLRHTNTSELLRTFNPVTALKIARQKLIKIEMSLSLRQVQNRQKQSRNPMIKVHSPSRHMSLLCSIKKFLLLFYMSSEKNNITIHHQPKTQTSLAGV